YPSIRFALHNSGCLTEWLSGNHPDYLDRVAGLVASGRVELIGGPWQEAILPMLPSRDRIGQIRQHSQWIERRLGAKVRGAWVPERVWEQSLASDLASAGIEYVILDDFHFKNAGLTDEQLYNYYITEDDGHLLKVFPGSERLRYTIPFADPQQTIDHLAYVAEMHPGSVVVFGDDGEKFGTWPGTHQHVYTNGWLRRFLDALMANQSWLTMCTLAEAVDEVPPAGKVYLPDSSYREMTEWALPAEQIVDYDRVCHELEHDPRWPVLKRFVRGGFWRNFKVKYPEADEMYTRMLAISQRLAAAGERKGNASSNGVPSRIPAPHVTTPLAGGNAFQLLDRAREELYRGQCNCAYWHGAFGGIYLPHLRNAIYQRLIAAENLLNQAVGRTGNWVEAQAADFNLDARQEVQLANDKLLALVAPSRGGQLYELDVRAIGLNLLATMTRHPEAYHRKVLAGQQGGGDVASIHERIIFKQEGLERRIQYDAYPRKSLLDHFYDPAASLEHVIGGQTAEQGDFLDGVFEARVRRSPNVVQVHLQRVGVAYGRPLRIAKSITVEAGNPALEIVYALEGLPPGQPIHFAVEFNFAGLPAGADDRYFFDARHQHLGHLGSWLDLHEVTELGLADEWLGIGVGLHASRPTHFWTFPIETVSQSEGGFELVHQSVAVLPHWHIVADENGRWDVALTLSLDTSHAESRQQQRSAASAAI
ncbi:MAG: alpha-amylase/4-alpha-glucanotransferase domain-containing protein, partial [Pirellulales bacterium]